LALKWRQQVQLITATLAVTSALDRALNYCRNCQECKLVTHAAFHQKPAGAPDAIWNLAETPDHAFPGIG
jgi:hypothetical protein